MPAKAVRVFVVARSFVVHVAFHVWIVTQINMCCRARGDLPLVIQFLLWGGGLITIAFTYFFGLKNIRAQSLMTAGLTGLIAFNLFLILVLDNPFHGYLRVTPEPLREILQRIQVIESS
jgi:hypothetical protein